MTGRIQGPRCTHAWQRDCAAMHGIGHPSGWENGEPLYWRHAGPDEIALVNMAVEAGLTVWQVDGTRLHYPPGHLKYPQLVLIPEHTLDTLAAQAVESIEKEHRDHQPQRPE